jgi:hypothetical protein
MCRKGSSLPADFVECCLNVISRLAGHHRLIFRQERALPRAWSKQRRVGQDGDGATSVCDYDWRPGRARATDVIAGRSVEFLDGDTWRHGVTVSPSVVNVKCNGVTILAPFYAPSADWLGERCPISPRESAGSVLRSCDTFNFHLRATSRGLTRSSATRPRRKTCALSRFFSSLFEGAQFQLLLDCGDCHEAFDLCALCCVCVRRSESPDACLAAIAGTHATADMAGGGA